MEPTKTVCDILNTVAARVCDDLCKWPEKYRDGDDEQEDLEDLRRALQQLPAAHAGYIGGRNDKA